MMRSTKKTLANARAFTLLELIVVIGIIAILVTLTVIAVGALAKDAKLAGGKNKVIAALGTARALAMETNTPHGVVFIVYQEDSGRQQTEAAIVRWAKDVTNPAPNIFYNRYIAADVDPIRLPAGVKVAAPYYGETSPGFAADELWITQPDFAGMASGEYAGRMFGVLFDANGSVITSIAETDINLDFFDRDNDGVQDAVANFNEYDARDKEPSMFWSPFLAVFDDDELRENVDESGWATEANMLADITSWVDTYSDRIHFNRYTGVVMK